MHESPPELTSRERWGLAGSALALFGVLAALSRAPAALVGIATATGIAWLIALVLARELAVSQRSIAVVVPALPLALVGCAALDPRLAVAVAAGLGVGLAVVALSPAGPLLHHHWVRTTAPIGWTISRGVLAVLYFGVLTPIGLVLRLVRPDPLAREDDSASFWTPRSMEEPPLERHFRQY